MAVVLSLEAQRASRSQGKPWLLLSSPFVIQVLTPVLQQAISGRYKPSCPVRLFLPFHRGGPWRTLGSLFLVPRVGQPLQLQLVLLFSSFQLGFPE